MLIRQQLGYLFEDKVHELISQCNYQVIREKEIVNKYSVLSNGIDHIVYLSDYIICIQDKWRDTKSSLSDINHFIKSVENIYIKENYKKCIGLYLTKVPITKGASNAFEYENSKGINYFLSINDDNMDLLLNKLTTLFYLSGIFFYEPDGCVIMNCNFY